MQDLHAALCSAAGTAGIRLQPYKAQIGHQLLQVGMAAPGKVIAATSVSSQTLTYEVAGPL